MNFRLRVAQQGAGQQTGFHQNLEAVADAEHQAAIRGELLHRLHHRREARDRAAAQIIAVREAAGQNDGIDVAQIDGIVPDELGFLAQDCD